MAFCIVAHCNSLFKGLIGFLFISYLTHKIDAGQQSGLARQPAGVSCFRQRCLLLARVYSLQGINQFRVDD
jgi:hypothetical protein